MCLNGPKLEPPVAIVAIIIVPTTSTIVHPIVPGPIISVIIIVFILQILIIFLLIVTPKTTSPFTHPASASLLSLAGQEACLVLELLSNALEECKHLLA